jgi:type I restriction enzyme M protein
VVIGNPPYVQIENIPESDRKYYAARYGEDGKLGKRYDLYQLFVMAGMRLLSRNGTLGLIIPNTFLMGHSYALLRRTMVGAARIIEIVDLPQGVFRGVTVDNVLLFLARDDQRSQRAEHTIEIKKLNPKSEKIRVATGDWDETFVIPQSRLLPDEDFKLNVHANPRQQQLFAKVERSDITLGDVTESSQGIILYRTEKDAIRSLHTGFKRKSGLQRLLRGKNIARYQTLWAGEYVDYGEWLWCAREPKYFTNPKILLHAMRNKSLARRLVGTYDDQCFFNAHNLANIILAPSAHLDLKFLLGIFNSTLINYWYKAHFPNVNINPSDFRQIPLPPIDANNPLDRKRHDEIVAHVDAMLSLHEQEQSAQTPQAKDQIRRQIDSTDRQIDQLVYQLYGLSEEEIKIVEEATK